MSDREEHSGGGGTISLVLLGLMILGGIAIWNHLKTDKWQLVDTNYGSAEISSPYDSEQDCLDDLHAGYHAEGECGSNCKLSSTLADLYVCDETAE